MKRKVSRRLSILICMAMFLSLLCIVPVAEQQVQAVGTTYYVNSSTGNDSWNGTSATYSAPNNGPWKTLSKVSGVTFVAGDIIKLESTQVWNEPLVLQRSGTTGTVTLTCNGSISNPPKIEPLTDVDGIKIINQGGWTIENVEISGDQDPNNNNENSNGIRIQNESSTASYSGITIQNVSIHGYIGKIGRKRYAPSGIMIGRKDGVGASMKVSEEAFTNVTIQNSTITDCTVGISPCDVSNMTMDSIVIKRSEYNGIIYVFGHDIIMNNLKVLDTGVNITQSFNGGNCGIAFGALTNGVIKNSEIGMVTGESGKPDMEAIDYEGMNENFHLINNYFHDIKGIAVLIMESGGPNTRYRISDNYLYHTGYRTDEYPGDPYPDDPITVCFLTQQQDTSVDSVVSGNTIYKSSAIVSGTPVPQQLNEGYPSPLPTDAFPSDLTAANNVVMMGYQKEQQGPVWYYQDYDPNSGQYYNMAWNATEVYWNGNAIMGQYDQPWNTSWETYYDDSFSSMWQHPGTVYDSALVWQAPQGGVVQIKGKAKLANSTGTDGVTVKIYKGTTQLWSDTLTTSSREKSPDNNGLVMWVDAGEKLYFRVGKNGNYDNDLTYWTPMVKYLASWEAGSASVAFDSNQGPEWYYKKKPIDPNSTTYSNLSSYYSPEAYWYQTSQDVYIGSNYLRPGTDYDAVLTWKAPGDAFLDINGKVHYAPWSTSGDGVNVKIKHKDISASTTTEMYSTSLSRTNTTAYPTGLRLFVESGDELYFEVNKGVNNTDDVVYWDPVINIRSLSADGGGASAGFSSTQGGNGWYYYECSDIDNIPGSLTQLTYDPNTSVWTNSSTGTEIAASWCRATASRAVVRAYKAPNKGNIKITGEAILYATSATDGVNAAIYKPAPSPTPAAPQVWYTLTNSSTLDNTYETDKAMIDRPGKYRVDPNEMIYFVVTCGKNGEGTNDVVLWDPKITYRYQENTNGTASTGFSGTQGQNNWYYRKTTDMSSYTNLDVYSSGVWYHKIWDDILLQWVNAAPVITKDEQLSGNGYYGVRTYVVPAGKTSISISGLLGLQEPFGTLGVDFYIQNERTGDIYYQNLRTDPNSLSNPSNTSAQVNIQNQALQAGDKINFNVLTYAMDSIYFDPNIITN